MKRRRPSAKLGVWHYREAGAGRPLVLLHGIGMSNAAWNAVMPYLARTRRVIAFDIAGFGLTPPLRGGVPPTVASLVDGLEWSLRGLDIEMPVDIAGNSLGATMALEAARRGFARSAVAIAPIGLWRLRPAPHVGYVFRALRVATRRFPGMLKAMMRVSTLRELALAVPFSTGSSRMPVRDAQQAVDDMARSTAFDETFAATTAPFSGRGIAVPVTVAFGSRDWILPKGSQHQEALPAETRWITKSGWGHVPMWADPAGVSQLILQGANARERSADRLTA